MAAEYNFVAPIWARRKVGYLLDQIRLNGESAEVKDELVRLARDYSIATPYTSLLVVPESPGAAIPACAGPALAGRRWRAVIAIDGGPSVVGGGMSGGMAGMGGHGRRHGRYGRHGRWHGRHGRWDGRWLSRA